MARLLETEQEISCDMFCTFWQLLRKAVLNPPCSSHRDTDRRQSIKRLGTAILAGKGLALQLLNHDNQKLGPEELQTLRLSCSHLPSHPPKELLSAILNAKIITKHYRWWHLWN